MKYVSKSIWLVVIALSLLFSCYPLHDVKATANKEITDNNATGIDLNKRISTVNEKPQNTDSSKRELAGSESKLQKIAKEQGMDVESSYQTYIAYDKDGNQTSSGQVTSENQRKTVEKKAKSIIYFSHTFLGGKVNKVMHGVEISKIVGIPPASAEVHQGLCKSGYYNKQFTCPHTIRKTFVGPQVKKGSEVHQFINVNKTTFWKYTGGAIATWAGKKPTVRTISWTEGLYLTNMKGMFFPSNYTDKQSGLNILAPPNAFIKWVPSDKRVKWGTTERKAYRNWYDKKYGKKTWVKFEIHHQLPREYGGGNQTSNLIPIDVNFHRKEVNPWWASYTKKK
ncbi:hypothetical protein CLI97_00136 [Bacillus velezensis]|uniref:hypothetical protein n=1 Tax=Bacillus velezensis TaxID=492670 RepID=UPI000BC0AD71|nr:hypothetical protein [Bacillus velezensis]ATC49473.1 hypothetical protein CLI97_00136 [Bacillus velezensis]